MNLPQEPMLREPKCDGCRGEAGEVDLPGAVAVGEESAVRLGFIAIGSNSIVIKGMLGGGWQL